MTGATIFPAACAGRRGGALLLALVAVLGTGGAAAQGSEPGPGWERIGSDARAISDVSFAPNEILWSRYIDLDTLDVIRTPRETWGQLATSGFRGAPVFFESADTFLVPGDFGVYRSRDRGRTIEILSRTFQRMYASPAGAARPGRIHFALGEGTALAYSDDQGTTFVNVEWPNAQGATSVRTWADMPGGAGPWGTGPSVHPGRMFAGGYIYGLGVSDDGGATWRQSSLWGFDIGVYFVTVLARPTEQGGGVRVVVLGEDTDDPPCRTQVWTSDDGGETFVKGAIIENAACFATPVALLPVVPGMASGGSNPVPSWTTSEALAVLLRGAVHRTTDGGLTWTRVPGPAGQVPLLVDDNFHRVRSAALGQDGRLYPATVRSGPYQEWPVRSTTNYAPVASEPLPAAAAVTVGPVVPNPASGRATLALALPAAARVTIDLFDVAGRLVRAGVPAETAAGPSRVTLDVAGLPAGVYVARVSVGAPGGTSAVSRRFTVTH